MRSGFNELMFSALLCRYGVLEFWLKTRRAARPLRIF
jgi:hypothetical protein